MDSDLLAVARTLAERGWLPGIAYMEGSVSNARPAHMLKRHGEGNFLHDWSPATEADIHLAAIKRVLEIHGTVLFGTLFIKLMVRDPTGIRMVKTYDADTKQGDTLALLRCLCSACEANEADRVQ